MRSRQPSLVIELLEDGNRRLELANDVLPADTGLLGSLEPYVDKSDCRVSCHRARPGCLPELQGLHEEGLRALQLARCSQDTAKSWQELEAPPIGGRKRNDRGKSSPLERRPSRRLES